MHEEQPLTVVERTVPDDWVDYNGHMNDGAYALAFSEALDALIDALGMDADYRGRERYAIYTLESHICYLREAHGGDQVSVDVQLLDCDAKRLHLFMRLCGPEGSVRATGEQMVIGIDTAAGRSAPFREPVAGRVEALRAAHESLPAPDQAGRRIGIRR